MTFNTAATAVLAPLRDGPLPRVTGPVFAKMGDGGKELVHTMGVSGVNVVKDGKELRAHNPHNTLVYSMAPFTQAVQDAMNQTAKEPQPDPSGRHQNIIQDSVHRRAWLRRQCAARSLPHRSG